MKHKSYTIEDLQTFAVTKGGKCLSSIYKHSKIKYNWECIEGHKWSANWNSILNGTWCKICANKQNGIKQTKYTIEHLKKYAASKNGKCLSNKYTNALAKYTWQCEGEKHIWEAAWNDVRSGHWCYYCSRETAFSYTRKYTIEDLQELVKKYDGKCLSTKYINNNTPYRWQCNKNHSFSLSISYIEQGNWCSKCEEFKRLQEKGAKLGLTLLEVNKKYSKWQCKCGEIFIKKGTTIYSTLFCNVCEKNKRNKEKLTRIKDIAISKKGVCLSDTYTKNYEKLDFICDKGHNWSTMPKSITDDNAWCPECTDFKTEKVILAFIQQYFPTASKIKLKDVNIDSKQELDIYIPELKLAIEYNGIYWHSEKFKETNYHYNKYKLCKDNGITLLQIFEDEWTHRQAQVKNFIKSKLGVNFRKISARKCEVRVVPKKEAIEFVNNYHIQKQINALIAFGLYYKEELIGVLVGNDHHRINNKENLILSRLVFKEDVTVQGGVSKLLKYFKEYAKQNNYKKIVTWSDLRYSEGNAYLMTGFNLTKQLKPDYSYMSPNKTKRKSKQCCKKANLSKETTTLTERQLAKDLGLLRVYDCGKLRFEMEI